METTGNSEVLLYKPKFPMMNQPKLLPKRSKFDTLLLPYSDFLTMRKRPAALNVRITVLMDWYPAHSAQHKNSVILKKEINGKTIMLRCRI